MCCCCFSSLNNVCKQLLFRVFAVWWALFQVSVRFAFNCLFWLWATAWNWLVTISAITCGPLLSRLKGAFATVQSLFAEVCPYLGTFALRSVLVGCALMLAVASGLTLYWRMYLWFVPALDYSLPVYFDYGNWQQHVSDTNYGSGAQRVYPHYTVWLKPKDYSHHFAVANDMEDKGTILKMQQKGNSQFLERTLQTGVGIDAIWRLPMAWPTPAIRTKDNYHVWLQMRVPRKAKMHEIGNVMVALSLLNCSRVGDDIVATKLQLLKNESKSKSKNTCTAGDDQCDSDGRTTSKNKKRGLKECEMVRLIKKPILVWYRPLAARLLDQFVWAVPYWLGLKSSDHLLAVDLCNDLPLAALMSSVLVADVSLSRADFSVFDATLRMDVRLSGVAFYLYHWWLVSAMFATAVLSAATLCCEVPFLVCACVRISSFAGGGHATDGAEFEMHANRPMLARTSDFGESQNEEEEKHGSAEMEEMPRVEVEEDSGELVTAKKESSSSSAKELEKDARSGLVEAKKKKRPQSILDVSAVRGSDEKRDLDESVDDAVCGMQSASSGDEEGESAVSTEEVTGFRNGDLLPDGLRQRTIGSS